MIDTSGITKLLVLGTGFSAPTGIPTMPHFFDTVWKLLGPPISFEQYHQGAFERVRDEWNKCSLPQGNKNNLEDFARYIYQNLPDLREDFIRVIWCTINITKTIPSEELTTQCGGISICKWQSTLPPIVPKWRSCRSTMTFCLTKHSYTTTTDLNTIFNKAASSR